MDLNQIKQCILDAGAHRIGVAAVEDILPADLGGEPVHLFTGGHHSLEIIAVLQLVHRLIHHGPLVGL